MPKVSRQTSTTTMVKEEPVELAHRIKTEVVSSPPLHGVPQPLPAHDHTMDYADVPDSQEVPLPAPPTIPYTPANALEHPAVEPPTRRRPMIRRRLPAQPDKGKGQYISPLEEASVQSGGSGSTENESRRHGRPQRSNPFVGPPAMRRHTNPFAAQQTETRSWELLL